MMMDHRGRGRGRHRRMRRGDIRTAVLAVLAEQPSHGYEVIQALEEKSNGAWRPSPGSIYPTLQLLEDEGLVQSTDRDGKRVYEITEAGRTESERRLEADGGPPWQEAEGSEMWQAMKQLLIATKQMKDAGNPAQIEKATAIIVDARKQLYRMLAED